MELYGEMKPALAGMLYGVNPSTIITGVSTDDIEMGKCVYNQSGEIKASGNEGQFMGIACFTQIGGCAGKNLYKAGQPINIITQGFVWAKIPVNKNPLINGKCFAGTDGTVNSGGT